MKIPVVLSIRGTQRYVGQEPEVIELVTEGELECSNGGWDLRYEESDLTGLRGVTTTFRIEPEKVTLKRTGSLKSEMVFQEGVSHNSLYEMEFGALMLTVRAQRVMFDLSEEGGMVDLIYGIEIEQNAAGEIDYHLEIRKK